MTVFREWISINSPQYFMNNFITCKALSCDFLYRIIFFVVATNLYMQPWLFQTLGPLMRLVILCPPAPSQTSQWGHMRVMASQITDNSTVCSTICSGWHNRKISASLVLFEGSTQAESPHKSHGMRRGFPCLKWKRGHSLGRKINQKECYLWITQFHSIC